MKDIKSRKNGVFAVELNWISTVMASANSSRILSIIFSLTSTACSIVILNLVLCAKFILAWLKNKKYEIFSPKLILFKFIFSFIGFKFQNQFFYIQQDTSEQKTA